MSLLELRAEMDRLKSSEHYARYLETEFDEAARDDVVRSFAQRFSSIEHLVQQQELLKVQASVQAGAAPSRMMETAEQRRVRLESSFSTFKHEFVREKGGKDKSLTEQARRNHVAGVALMTARELVPDADSPAMVVLAAQGLDDSVKDIEELRTALDQGIAHCMQTADNLIIAYKHSWEAVSRMDGECDLRLSDERAKALKEALAAMDKEADRERASKVAKNASNGGNGGGGGGYRHFNRRGRGHSGFDVPPYGPNQLYANALGAGRGMVAPPTYGNYPNPAFFPGAAGRGRGH